MRPTLGNAGATGGEITRFISAALRHKWILLMAAAASVGLGFVASRYFHPEYAAQGTIWIQGSNDRDGGNAGPIVQTQLLRSYAWVELLKAWTVLDHVVTQEKLYIEPANANDRGAFAAFQLHERFRPGKYKLTVAPEANLLVLSTADGAEIERAPVGQPIGSRVGFTWTLAAEAVRAGSSIDFTVFNPRDVAIRLANELEANMAEDGRFLRLQLTGRDPHRLAGTLNAIMTRYVEVAAQLKRAKLDELTKILEEQRDYAERNLRDSEMALEGFRIQTITLPQAQGAPVAAGIEITRDPVFTNFFDLKVNLEDLRRDRDALTSVLQKAAAGSLPIDALTSVPAAQNNAVITRLLTELNDRRAEQRVLQRRYTSEHGPVRTLQTQIAALENVTIPAAVRELMAQLQERERDLQARIASASSELREIPPRAIEEARLQRRVEIAATLHGTLRQRFEEARLAAVSSIPDVRVLDHVATPFAPVKDLRKLVVAGFGLGGIGLALLGILLHDRTDRRVRYPEQITAGLGLPILGAVPHVKRGMTNASENGLAQLAEAFRELRFSIVHAHGSAGPLILSLTSPESGDGKSLIATNLAAIFAHQGHRVLLLDGDVRRGSLHRALGVGRTPGLTDYLIGQARRNEVMRETANGFTLIPCGTRMQRSPELLGCAAMPQLIQEMRLHYDVIILDTPPLSAGVDAYLLGTLARNMIVVLRTGVTDAQLAEAKLDVLDRLPVRLLGAVLNDVPSSRIYRYYSYLSGYEPEDESLASVEISSVAASSEV